MHLVAKVSALAVFPRVWGNIGLDLYLEVCVGSESPLTCLLSFMVIFSVPFSICLSALLPLSPFSLCPMPLIVVELLSLVVGVGSRGALLRGFVTCGNLVMSLNAVQALIKGVRLPPDRL